MVAAFVGCARDEEVIAEPAIEQELAAGSSDRYSCVTSSMPGCAKEIGIGISLEAAGECKEGVDFTVTTKNDRPKEPLILTIHGGRIEFGTAEIGAHLSGTLGWDHYTFEAAPKGPKCAEPRWMHVTSNRFNAAVAVEMAERHPTAVSLHGYSEDNPERTWAKKSKTYICVGGLNAGARASFIAAMNEPRLKIGALTVEAFDASRASDEAREICGGLQGKGPTNVVNQPPAKGLQLELPALVRATLVGSGGYELDPKLRERFTDAIEASLSAK